MLLDYMMRHFWAANVLWALLYCSDYGLTLVGARAYRSGANRHFVHTGGYELTPVFRKDIAALRVVSPRFVFHLALSSACIAVLGLIARPMDIVPIFEFLLGSLILPELHVLTRHVHNLVTFRYAARSLGLRGRVEMTMWLSLRISFVQHLAYAGVWLVLLTLTGRWMFAGGAFKELLLGLKQREQTDKESPVLPEEPREPVEIPVASGGGSD